MREYTVTLAIYHYGGMFAYVVSEDVDGAILSIFLLIPKLHLEYSPRLFQLFYEHLYIP